MITSKGIHGRTARHGPLEQPSRKNYYKTSQDLPFFESAYIRHECNHQDFAQECNLQDLISYLNTRSLRNGRTLCMNDFLMSFSENHVVM